MDWSTTFHTNEAIRPFQSHGWKEFSLWISHSGVEFYTIRTVSLATSNHRSWRITDIKSFCIETQEATQKNSTNTKHFLPNLNSIEYSLTVFVKSLCFGCCVEWCCNKCVHLLKYCGSKDVFCVIKMHNKKAQNHEL